MSSDIQHKTINAEIKSVNDEGQFSAVIATLGVIDSDDDIIEHGAFGEQVVNIQPAHDFTSVPLGKGVITEVGDEAIVHGKMNLATQAGRDWHAALKFDTENPPAIQEWSFGFRVKDAESAEQDGKRVRLLKSLDVFEASPVLLGAGINTRTLHVKSRFADHIDTITREIEILAKRTQEIIDMRGMNPKSKDISRDRIKQLDELIERADSLYDQIQALKQLGRARRPTFSGTETTPWSKPTLQDYKSNWSGNADFGSIGDAPMSFKRWVARHTLLGDPNGETLDEVSFFPVVNPATGNLNANALRAVLSGRGAQADIPETALDSARAMARRLLDSEFSKSETVTPEEKALAIVLATKSGIVDII